MSMRPATTYPTVVGQVLAARRAQLALAQTDLAAAVGVSQSTWSKIERGDSALTIEQLGLAARALKVEPSALLARAEAMAAHLRKQSINVMPTRTDEAATTAFVLISVAAIAAILVAVASKE